jgi:CubicO group peptidase (beta-lactamase class C family)
MSVKKRVTYCQISLKFFLSEYFRKTLIALIIVFFSFNFSYSQNYLHRFERQNITKKLDDYLTEYYRNRDVASISAGIWHRGKIVWLAARGYADLGNKIPATTNTKYRIASISKVITAVAVMQLVENGKIKLDDDARKYIPYFPKKKWKFTVRQILQHTAGLRTYKTGEFNSTSEYPTTEDAVNVISRDPLVFRPGTKFLYTTLGYNLLAAIIEKVSGIDFNNYLIKNIFIPAGMTSTYLDIHKEIIPDRAKGYVKNLYRKFENAPLSDLSIKYAGGGIISTAQDKLIKHSTLDSMIVPAKLSNGKILDTGLGFDLKYDKNHKYFFGHYGHGTGFLSLLAIFPKDSTVVVHLVNTADRNVDEPALDLAAIYLENSFIYPPISLADRMMDLTLHSSIDSALKQYDVIKKDSSYFYDLSANELNNFGYDLLKIKKHSEAIKWFKKFCEDFPNDTSAFIGLGDSYLNDNNLGLALKAYRKVLSIDSNNSYAKKMIQKLDSLE